MHVCRYYIVSDRALRNTHKRLDVYPTCVVTHNVINALIIRKNKSPLKESVKTILQKRFFSLSVSHSFCGHACIRLGFQYVCEKPRLGTKKRKLTAIGDKIPILTTE